MKMITTLALCAALAGCGSTPGKHDNRLFRTLTGDRAVAALCISSTCITFELSADDARELRTMREKARMFDLLRAVGAVGSPS